MTAQTKIDIEREAGRMLREMITTGTCERHYSDAVIHWLSRREYLYESLGGYRVTRKGHDYYDELCANSIMRESTRQFRDEALTGAVEQPGKAGPTLEPTDLTAAALPSTRAGHHETKTPDQLYGEMRGQADARDAFRRQHGLTQDEYRKADSEGRIRWCRTCETVSLFHKRGQRGFQNRCQTCRKERRK